MSIKTLTTVTIRIADTWKLETSKNWTETRPFENQKLDFLQIGFQMVAPFEKPNMSGFWMFGTKMMNEWIYYSVNLSKGTLLYEYCEQYMQ